MIEFGSFRLDLADERIWKGSKLLTVRRKPFAILRYLVGHPRRLVTHEELLEHVWGGAVVSESAMRTHLHELRQLLGEGVIETVIGRGYRFTADLVERAPEASAPALASPARTIIGRDRELAMLRAAFERAHTGHRQLCFITGDPGIGKTTLVDAFLDEVEIHARGQCIEQHGTPEAYFAVIEMLVALRARMGDQATTALVRYAPTFLSLVPHLCPDAQLADIARRTAGSDSRVVRELIEAIEAIAAQHTIAIVLEDLQWSDVATLDLLALLGQRRERARLLVIITSRRAEAQTAGHPLHQIIRPLTARATAVAIPLDRFADDSIRQLIDTRFPNHALPAGFAETIAQITGGSPLFVTSLLDDLAHRGMVGERAGRWELAVTQDELAAHRPDNLKQLIDIQLDRLTPNEQRVLEAASVVGLEPATALAAAALELPEETIDELCDSLARRSLFLRRAPADELPDGTLLTRYAFIHGLVQEVCIGRCSAVRRQRWHRLIAERLEALYGDHAGEAAHLLARHFDEGRVAARAIHYYIVAAERAARRFAGPDTLVLFKRAEQLVLKAPAGHERDVIELRVLQGLSTTILRTNEPSTDPLALFDRTSAIAKRIDDVPALCAALINTSVRQATLGNYQRAAEITREVEELERATPLDDQLQLFRDTARVLPMIWRGQLAPALATLERLTAVELSDDGRLGILGPSHRRTVLIAYLSLLTWLLGQPDRAIAEAERARTLAHEAGDPFTLGLAYCNLARLRIMRGESTALVRTAAEHVIAMPLAFVWHSAAHLLLGWADASDGRLDAAGADAVLRAYRERIARFPMGASHLAMPVIEALRNAGKPSEALALADDILREIARRDERILESEIVRQRGELVEDSDPATAVAAFREAIAIAHAQGAISLELRAANRLAAHDRSALGLVRELRGRFTEGLDTADLIAARELAP